MGVTVAVVAGAVVLIGAIAWMSRGSGRTAVKRPVRAGRHHGVGEAGASTWLVTSNAWSVGGSCDTSSSSSSSCGGGGGGGCGGGGC